MNRLKLWLYLALLLCAGTASLYGLSRWLTHRAIAQIDRELTRAVAQVDARSQLLAVDAALLADAVARDPAVLQALSTEGEVRAASAAQSAAQSARGSVAESARSQLVATAGRGWRTFTVNGAPIQTDGQLEILVSGAAVDAARREGYVVVGDALYYLVATPAGRGTSVAVGVPVNVAWLASLRVTTGCDATLLLDQRAPRGTLPHDEAELVANAVRGASGPVGVGTLPAQPAAFGVPIPAPSLPLLFASAPAYRAHPVALRGLPGGTLALSQPTGALLAPVVGCEWLMLAGLVILLLVGVATTLSITNEQETMVPKDLVAAADRIARRDFTARAPVMAGSLGTVAAALNCAAEAARSAGAARADTESLPAVAPSEDMAAAAPPAGAETSTRADVFGAFSDRPGPIEGAATTEAALALESTATQEPAPAHESAASLDPFALLEPPAAQELGAQEPLSGLEPSPSQGSVFGEESASLRELAAAQEFSAAPETSAGEPSAAQQGAPAETGWPSAAAFAAQSGEQLAGAAQEPEPMPGAEPLLSPPAFAEPPPENGALLRAPEPASSVFEPAGYTMTGASPVAAQEGRLEPTAAATEAGSAYETVPEATAQLPLPPVSPAAEESVPFPAPDGDEEHWRVTYDEFLKVRDQCGESRQGVPYDRFRQKLQKNRDQLVAKYGCRTVRFQVYVKEGRAALKASPVR